MHLCSCGPSSPWTELISTHCHVRVLVSVFGTIARMPSTFPPMPLLGFDIETANIITLAPDENLDDHGPLANLSRMQHEGHSIVAWNGLSFDE